MLVSVCVSIVVCPSFASFFFFSFWVFLIQYVVPEYMIYLKKENAK